MRRLLEEKNYFCTCGHVKRQHEGHGYDLECQAINDLECQAIIEAESNYYFTSCKCPGYRLDNLKYLEKLSNERPI